MNNIGADPNDRKIGEYWEDEFCKMARRYGWEAWPFQRRRGATFEFNGKSYVCPDVWILRRNDKQYICEIKHKNAAKNGCYGFEQYRQDSMLGLESDYQNQFGGVEALYVVHNHDAAGGKYNTVNNEAHWHAQRLRFLADNAVEGKSKTLYNGEVTEEEVPIFYYPLTLFVPVALFLQSSLFEAAQ